MICTREDPQGRKTIYEYLDGDLQRLNYIGRLDLQSRGLILLTDDGELSQRLTRPENNIKRLYKVRLDRDLENSDIRAIEKGIILEDETEFRPARVKKVGKSVEITLREGKNREIRRMMEHLGYRVEDLTRLEFAGIELAGLGPGQSRQLEEEEFASLYYQVGLQ